MTVPHGNSGVVWCKVFGCLVTSQCGGDNKECDKGVMVLVVVAEEEEKLL